jgi:hypothetical protein
MLVSFAAEHLDDLSSARRLAVHATGLDPVTYAGAWFHGLGRHVFTSFDAIKSLGREPGIGDGSKPAAVIYGCALRRRSSRSGSRPRDRRGANDHRSPRPSSTARRDSR